MVSFSTMSKNAQYKELKKTFFFKLANYMKPNNYHNCESVQIS